MSDMPIEIYETPDGKARFYFSHSDEQFTTGILVIQPGAALPKHNRPLAYENLTQVIGKCRMTLFDNNDNPTDYDLVPGEGIRMEKGQWHIHANPFDEVSATLFKAEGNILDVMKVLKETNTLITTNKPKNL